MNDTFSEIPNFELILKQRLAMTPASNPNATVDPYQMMLNRKTQQKQQASDIPVQVYPESQIKALEDYCKKMGIVGYNCGTIPPGAALALLKNQLGDFTVSPLEQSIAPKKQLLHD